VWSQTFMQGITLCHESATSVATPPGDQLDTMIIRAVQRKVGASGPIVGIDESEQMLEIVGERVAEHGWDNVRLLAAPVAQAPIDGTATPPCSVRCMTCCNPRRHWPMFLIIYVSVRRWLRPAEVAGPRLCRCRMLPL
jgi:hypothetical protein